MYRVYTKDWCGFKSKFTDDIAPFFCVCPVYGEVKAAEDISLKIKITLN
jgi:hypothetical protein